MRELFAHEYFRLLPIFLMFYFAGCIADPEIPDNSGSSEYITSGVIVVNEGIWRQDNSTLTAYDPVTRTTLQDYFNLMNPGRRLGDIANSISVLDGRGYIAVSTSLNVEVVELGTGRSVGRLHLRGTNEPRHIAFAGSTRGFVTTLTDSVFEFDPHTLEIRRAVATGPAPEGLAAVHNRLFVANSGFGLYRQEEPKAGTLSVLRLGDLSEEKVLPVGPNPRGVHYLPLNDRLYVMYGFAGAEGGLVEIDPISLEETARWPVMDPRSMALDQRSGIAYLAGADGITMINLLSDAPFPAQLVPAANWPRTIFHSVGVAPDGLVYVGAVPGYTAPGEILMFDRDGVLRDRFPAGLNPKDYAFF